MKHIMLYKPQGNLALAPHHFDFYKMRKMFTKSPKCSYEPLNFFPHTSSVFLTALSNLISKQNSCLFPEF